MTDCFSPEKRSAVMRAVKSKNTTPEIRVRKTLHAMGYRFRLHRKDLPGSPDIVLPKHNLALFVHGCFWHGHHCKRGQRIPAANRDYWVAKVDRNKKRDKANIEALQSLGWRISTVWECETRASGQLCELLSGMIWDSG